MFEYDFIHSVLCSHLASEYVTNKITCKQISVSRYCTVSNTLLFSLISVFNTPVFPTHQRSSVELHLPAVCHNLLDSSQQTNCSWTAHDIVSVSNLNQNIKFQEWLCSKTKSKSLHLSNRWSLTVKRQTYNGHYQSEPENRPQNLPGKEVRRWWERWWQAGQ